MTQTAGLEIILIGDFNITSYHCFKAFSQESFYLNPGRNEEPSFK